MVTRRGQLFDIVRSVNTLTARGFPACAGIDRLQQMVSLRLVRLPRLRGDRPGSGACRQLTVRWLPRLRGDRPCLRRRSRIACCGFPACAGIDPRPTRCRCACGRASPPARGSTRTHARSSVRMTSASPPARGSTRASRRRRLAARRLPRLRGDRPVLSIAGCWRIDCVAGRLPRLRGDRPVADAVAEPRHGFPACAGIDPACARTTSCASNGFPACAGIDLGRAGCRNLEAGFPACAGIDPTDKTPRRTFRRRSCAWGSIRSTARPWASRVPPSRGRQPSGDCLRRESSSKRSPNCLTMERSRTSRWFASPKSFCSRFIQVDTSQMKLRRIRIRRRGKVWIKT